MEKEVLVRVVAAVEHLDPCVTCPSGPCTSESRTKNGECVHYDAYMGLKNLLKIVKKKGSE